MKGKKEKLRILIALESYPPQITGSGIATKRLAEGLSSRGHHVEIICPGNSMRYSKDIKGDVTVHRINSVPIPFHKEFRCSFFPAAFLNSIFEQVKPDILHTHTAKAGTSARIAVSAYNLFCAKHVRVVHTFHGHIFKGYFSHAKSLMFVWIERLFAMVTDVIIAISETQKRELAYKYRIAPHDKIKIIELGFELLPFLSCNLLKGQFRRKFGIDDDTLLIGIIGRLAPIKNHMMFLNAAKLFIEDNPDIRVKFLVVGDGELRHDLEAYCYKQGLSDHVLFCGWIRDVPSVYSDLDILALTSINEGTPVSIIEAMASSVPVIATDAGGVLDLLGTPDNVSQSNGFTVCERGILCWNDDVFGFSKGLEYLIENGISETKERIKRARVFVEQRYSQEQLLNNMEETYLKLMENEKDTL